MPMKKIHSSRILKYSPVSLLLAAILFAGLICGVASAGAKAGLKSIKQASPLPPPFALLDEAGENVLDSGQPVSAEETCGACHDTAFITSHTKHAGLGADPFPAPGAPADGKQAGVEMNCFLCHTPAPNNTARKAALASGQPAWASTATLLGSGIVESDGVGFR